MRKRLALATLSLLSLMIAPSRGEAYAVKTSQSGVPLRWKVQIVPYHINTSTLPHYLDVSNVVEVIQHSFATWQNVSTAYLSFRYAGTTDDTSRGYTIGGTNHNAIIFETKDWEHDEDMLAVTQSTYNPKTGEIIDTDIYINGVHFMWTTSDLVVHTDLQNMLTHEIGHFAGLDHSEHLDATMFAQTTPRELEKRTLHSDDESGLQFLYPNPDAANKPQPKQTISPVSDPTSTTPGEAGAILGHRDDPYQFGCSTNTINTTPLPWSMMIFALAALLWLRRRRQQPLRVRSKSQPNMRRAR